MVNGSKYTEDENVVPEVLLGPKGPLFNQHPKTQEHTLEAKVECDDKPVVVVEDDQQKIFMTSRNSFCNSEEREQDSKKSTFSRVIVPVNVFSSSRPTDFEENSALNSNKQLPAYEPVNDPSTQKSMKTMTFTENELGLMQKVPEPLQIDPPNQSKITRNAARIDSETTGNNEDAYNNYLNQLEIDLEMEEKRQQEDGDDRKGDFNDFTLKAKHVHPQTLSSQHHHLFQSPYLSCQSPPASNQAALDHNHQIRSGGGSGEDGDREGFTASSRN